jgi:serine/threonine protein kinase
MSYLNKYKGTLKVAKLSGERSPVAASPIRAGTPVAVSPVAVSPIRAGRSAESLVLTKGLMGSYTYGDSAFITACITEFTRKSITPTLMRGAFGTVYKITVGVTDYYVKKIVDVNPENIKREIETAINLTRDIPQHVSNIKGARYDLGKDDRYVGYLIYEAPSGMNLREFITANPPTRENIPLYNSLYLMIKVAQQAINAKGYVHQDIKPENIFVILKSGNPIGCKLIDFGLTKKAGEIWRGEGTRSYMPNNMANKVIRQLWRHNTNLISAQHNNTSVKIIWTRDFKRTDPPPHIGGRTLRKRSKRMTKKLRSS